MNSGQRDKFNQRDGNDWQRVDLASEQTAPTPVRWELGLGLPYGGPLAPSDRADLQGDQSWFCNSESNWWNRVRTVLANGPCG